jgi:hypothetical protein
MLCLFERWSHYAPSLQGFFIIPVMRTAYPANRIIFDFIGQLTASADEKEIMKNTLYMLYLHKTVTLE